MSSGLPWNTARQAPTPAQEPKVYKSSAVIIPQSPANLPNIEQNMATMTMQHNAPAVPTKPGQQTGGNFQANSGIAGQNQQGRVQYSQNSPQYSQQQSAQNPGQTTVTQTTQQWSSQNPEVRTSTQQWTTQNPGQTNKFSQQSSTQQNQVNQQGSYANQQQQYTQQGSYNQSNQQQQNNQNQQQQRQQGHTQTASINLQQQGSVNDGHSNQQNQQQNAQWQQQQQNLRGQQIHPSPMQAPRPQQQQQGYQNGSAGMPPAASGARGAPSFLAKKHFVANQEQTEWKNKSMRKVERQNSQSFQQESQYNQVDSDEDGHLPEFTSNIHDISDLREGERAHFDCCLIPQLVGDSSLKVIWTKNGQNVQTSNRVLIQESFGRLSLDIIGVRQEDSGVYQCYVTNAAGDAATQGKLTVIAGKTATHVSPGETQGMEGGSRFIQENIHEDRSTEKPDFTERLAESLSVEEGEPLRLQATLKPANDPLMKIEWFFNGQALRLGSRLATFYDFGLVTLSVLDARAEDSGLYVCRATNSLGRAETSCRLSCQPKGKSVVKPSFQEQLVVTPAGDLNEGDYVHLETRIEPRNDPYVIIEWFHNDKLIQTGQRLRPHHDFGIVTLDIAGAYGEDTGSFTVRATNSLGSDSSSANIRVAGKPGLLLETQHPEGLQKIADLEYKDFSKEWTYNDFSKHEPQFVEQLPRLPDFNEGERLRLEAQVEPRGDPNMKVEWYVNGRPVSNGSRTRTTFDFGFCSLDINDIQVRDAGEYTIVATNSLGTSESKTFLKVIGRGGIVSDPQYAASLDKIRDLESYENGPGYIPDNIQEDRPTAPPTFTEQLQPVPELHEGQSIHLECTIHPPNDPTLQIEWFRDGRPVHTGSRFRSFNDFGAVGLDILTVIPEDSGEYVIKATNAMGSNTSSVRIQVRARASIILESQAPGGAEKIRELEDMLNYKPQTNYDEAPQQAPVFTQQLRGPPGKIKEGQSVHLEASLQPVGDPSMKVEWFFNGRPLNTGSRVRFTHDMDYVALDMMYVFPRDNGEYSVKATNATGTAVSSATVHCFGKKAIITESQNPRALKKIQDLEAWNL